VKKYKVVIQGVSDYLQNQMKMNEGEDGNSPSGAKPTGTSVKTKEAAEQEYNDKTYKDDQGCYIPAKHIEACLVEASKDFQIKGKGKKTWKDIFKGLVIVEERRVRFTPNKLEPDEPFPEITRNKTTGGRRVTVRPLFKEGYQVEFTIDLLDDNISTVLEDVIKHGGFYKGIGDYRPKFGRFTLVSCKEIK
jgi:hypothetical protein